jgi:hypothetical protein
VTGYAPSTRSSSPGGGRSLVERFFRDITQDCIREGSFGSIQELVKAITDYLAERNLEPKAYKWKADGKQILEKIQRARKAMANV